MRKAATLALDREGINQALTLGHSLITGSIVPKDYEVYWQPPKIPYDPAAARKLLAEAGFQGGFDAGEYFCDSSYANLGEAALNSLQEVGIRVKLRPIERAAFTKEYGEKKYRNLIQGGSGAFGNAATRMETFVVKGGAYVYGSYPDIDELFAQQAAETDRAKRAPSSCTACSSWCTSARCTRRCSSSPSSTARVRGSAEAAFSLISGHPYSAPYEDVPPEGRRIAGDMAMVSPSLRTTRRGVLGLSVAAMIGARPARGRRGGGRARSPSARMSPWRRPGSIRRRPPASSRPS